LEVLSVPGSGGPLISHAVAHCEALSAADLMALESRQADLLGSWLLSDSMLRSDSWTQRINWRAVFGLSLATAVSIGIWTGVAMAVVSIWK
jgi:hypothetical protein